MASLRLMLEQLGLPTHSADVYVRLLRLGESKAADLISESGTHRQLVYAALKDLERRGFAKSVKRDGVAHFQALSLDPLLSDIRKKEQLAVEALEEAGRMNTAPKTDVFVFQGTQGINDFMELVLDTAEPVKLIGAHFRFKEVYPELWYPWHKKRAERGMTFQAIVPRGVESGIAQDLESAESRSVDLEAFPNVVWLFGEYVGNIVWIDREETVAFVIRHEAIARQQREYFDLLWKSGR